MQHLCNPVFCQKLGLLNMVGAALAESCVSPETSFSEYGCLQYLAFLTVSKFAKLFLNPPQRPWVAHDAWYSLVI